MTSYPVVIDLDHILTQSAGIIGMKEFPHLHNAVGQVIEEAHAQWSAYAAGLPLPDGSVIANRTGEYLRSIMIRQGPRTSGSEFSGEVFSELPYAQAIETGSPVRDMKKILNTSLKVRLTKDGRRYLIIPFRHDTPGSVMGNPMPKAVHAWWTGRIASHITSDGLNYRRPSGTGAFDIHTRRRIMVPVHKYQYGDRLRESDLTGMGIGGKHAKQMVGMLNFRSLGASGGAAHSSFITFRVMVEGGKGWIAPAQAGKFPARVTADLIKPMAERAFEAAVKADIADILGA